MEPGFEIERDQGYGPETDQVESPSSEIWRSVERLEVMAANLDQQLSDLTGRLSPVTVPRDPVPTPDPEGKTVGPPDQPYRSPLSDRLEEVGYTMNRVSNRVAMLLTFLDI